MESIELSQRAAAKNVGSWNRSLLEVSTGFCLRTEFNSDFGKDCRSSSSKFAEQDRVQQRFVEQIIDIIFVSLYQNRFQSFFVQETIIQGPNG